MRESPRDRRLRSWVDDFIEQLAVFPKGAHDDDVDAFTQLLLRWRHQRALGFPIGVGYRVSPWASVGGNDGARW